MKKIYYAMMTLLCAVVVTSCSKGSGKLLDAVPAESNVVTFVNIEAIVESSGGSISGNQIKLSEDVEELLSATGMKDVEEFNDKLKDSGIDPKNIVFSVSEKYDTFILYQVNDEKKFKNWLEDNDYEEEDTEDGLVLYKQGYGTFTALKDGIAYYFHYYDEKPMRMAKKFIEAAKDEPFSKLPVSNFILEGNAAGVAVKLPKEAINEMKDYGMPKEAREMLKGYMCFTGNLDGNEATIKAKVFNEEGKSIDLSEFKKYGDITAKVSDKALAFMAPDEILVGAVAYKDVKWNKIIDAIEDAMHLSSRDKEQLGEVESYLKNIDGTLAFGVGLTNGLESAISLMYGYEVGTNLSATMVVECKEGKANGVLKDLKKLVGDMGVTCENTSDGFKVSVPDVEVYCEAHDNFIVVSNHKISKSNDNATVKGIDFGKYNAAMGIVAPAKGKLMKSLDLNFDVKASMYTKASDVEMGMTLTIDGGKAKGIIAKAIELVNAAIENAGKYSDLDDEVRQKARPSRSSNPYDDYEEWNPDSIAVDEECVEVVEEDYYY